jgi:hypothetical protein
MDSNLRKPDAAIIAPDSKKLQPSNNRIRTTVPDLQSLLLQELRELKALGYNAANDPSLKFQARSNLFLQVFGLLAATLFGVFAILAWISANKSNSLSFGANEMASSANDFAYNADRLASEGNQMASSAWDQANAANLLAFLVYCDTVSVIYTCLRV